MGNALIVNGSHLTPCTHGCARLLTLLQRTNFFDRVHERSLEAPQKDIHLTADVILPRFSLKDWTKEGVRFWKRTWASAKTFAVLCDQSLKHGSQIPPALIDVDDFLV